MVAFIAVVAIVVAPRILLDVVIAIVIMHHHYQPNLTLTVYDWNNTGTWGLGVQHQVS